MPHVVYLAAAILCPWPGCGFQIELVDFQLEHYGDPALYNQVMAAWGLMADYGLIGRCPGCGEQVLFGLDRKVAVHDVFAFGLPQLPDDWHHRAFIA